MGENLGKNDVMMFLEQLGENYPHRTDFYLLGGSALSLLGSPRLTADIDYTSDESDPLLAQWVEQLADRHELDIEAVPIDEFIPLPLGAESRHRKIGQFNRVSAYIFDPYSIALSKVDRGFDKDIEDIQFLLTHNFIELDRLASMVDAALPYTVQYDLDPSTMRRTLALIQDWHSQQ